MNFMTPSVEMRENWNAVKALNTATFVTGTVQSADQKPLPKSEAVPALRGLQQFVDRLQDDPALDRLFATAVQDNTGAAPLLPDGVYVTSSAGTVFHTYHMLSHGELSDTARTIARECLRYDSAAERYVLVDTERYARQIARDAEKAGGQLDMSFPRTQIVRRTMP